MIVLFTDYGPTGPYVGQLHGVLAQAAPGVKVVDLIHDAPRCNPRAAAYLLAAYAAEFPIGSVFVAVVDPGVGTGAAVPAILRAGSRWFVGPDNGLFDVLRAHDASAELREILWRPLRLSRSFHGRDLYAPVAARIASGPAVEFRTMPGFERPRVDPDLDEVIYIDAFGNAMTGRRAAAVDRRTLLRVNESRLSCAQTFGEVAPGAAFWYENSVGLVEIAVNQGRADVQLGLTIGTKLHFH